MKPNLLPLALGLLLSIGPAQAAESLAEQLRELAEQHHFTLRGAERAEDAPPSPASGELPQRLRSMLRGFDFVLVQPPKGKVERLIIIGPKGEPPPMVVEKHVDTTPQESVIETQRAGNQHRVSAALTGMNGEVIELDLLVDTGASSVVLPRSMAPRLGIPEDALTQREVQTANGITTAWISSLPKLRLGDQEANDVEVAFVDDPQLGGMALLGMSLLSRYKIVLDQGANTLLLLPPSPAQGR